MRTPEGWFGGLSRGPLRRASLGLAVAGALAGSVLVALPVAADAIGSLPAYNTSWVPSVSSAGATAVDSVTHRVYVANVHLPTVTVVDGLTRFALATIAMPGSIAGLAVDSGTHRLFVASRNPIQPSLHGSFSVIDTLTNAVLITSPLTFIGQVSIAVDTVSHRVVVTACCGPSSIEVLDEAGNTASGQYFGPPDSTAVAIDPVLQRIYVTSSTASTLTVYDGKTLHWVAMVQVGASPGTVTVDPRTHQIYVANNGSDSLSVVDGTLDVVKATINLGAGPFTTAIDASSSLLYVTNLLDGTVTVVDASTNRVAAVVNVPGGAAAVQVDSVSHSAWVTGSGLADAGLSVIDPVVARRAGADRFATAASISAAAFDSAGADAVVLARADTYPDALVGAPLAAAKNAPLLYTSGTALPPATKTEIARVLAPGKTVYLLGGTAAIPDSVATQLRTMGYVVDRLSGSNRYATAVAVADALGDPTTAFVATSTTFADALAAGPAATKAGGVILLTNGSQLPPETSAYLQAHAGASYAVGGSAAIADPSASPLAGADRYATAALVAQQFFVSPTTVGLASGTTFADALPASAYLSRTSGPLLLTDPGTLPGPAAAYLTAAQSGVTTALVFGGPSAVSAAAEAQITAALGR